VGPLLAQLGRRQSKDGLTYTFKLRTGREVPQRRAASPRPMSLWSWKRYMDPKTDWRCLSEYDGRGGLKVVETSVTAPDDADLRHEDQQTLRRVPRQRWRAPTAA
jgi:peptide/nickel transport system substrate-binding protein